MDIKEVIGYFEKQLQPINAKVIPYADAILAEKIAQKELEVAKDALAKSQAIFEAVKIDLAQAQLAEHTATLGVDAAKKAVEAFGDLSAELEEKANLENYIAEFNGALVAPAVKNVVVEEPVVEAVEEPIATIEEVIEEVVEKEPDIAPEEPQVAQDAPEDKVEVPDVVTSKIETLLKKLVIK